MILIIDVINSTWSSFDTRTLKEVKKGVALSRTPTSKVEAAGLIVRQVRSGESLVKAEEINRGDLTKEESAVLKSLQNRFPGKPIWIISDSAYFKSLPVSAFSYAVADNLVRRVGLHGLIHASLAMEAARALGKPLLSLNLLTLYLDKDSSITAIKDGIPIETSSGLSPLEGLPGARSVGSIDGEVVLNLAAKHGIEGARKILLEDSGLLGMSGLKGDLAKIISSPKLRNNPQFLLAMKVYLHRLGHHLGAYQALIGRVDGIVFSGLLGSKSSFVRGEISKLGLLRYSNILTLEAKPHHLAAEMIHRHL